MPDTERIGYPTYEGITHEEWVEKVRKYREENEGKDEQSSN